MSCFSAQLEGLSLFRGLRLLIDICWIFLHVCGVRAEIYKRKGYELMGAAFEVYNHRGYGLVEEIYQECLEIELALRSIPFCPKAEINCFYKGRELKRRYMPDLFVFHCLLVELKAVTAILPEHQAQLLNYMRLARQPIGYLINFGHENTLEWKRFILSEFIPQTAEEEENRLSPLTNPDEQNS